MFSRNVDFMPTLNTAISSAALGAALCVGGCFGTPNQDNIRLRKLNQDLTAQVGTLQQQADARQRTIDGLLQRSSSLQTLSPEEIRRVWTASGIKFGRLTGGWDVDASHPMGKGLTVFLTPIDDSGSSTQAAGSFVIEAFDLANAEHPYLGRWTFASPANKANWRNFLLEFGYELHCPWQTVPTRKDITLRAAFTDELTRAVYTAQTQIKLAGDLDLGAAAADPPKLAPPPATAVAASPTH